MIPLKNCIVCNKLLDFDKTYISFKTYCCDIKYSDYKSLGKFQIFYEFNNKEYLISYDGISICLIEMLPEVRCFDLKKDINIKDLAPNKIESYIENLIAFK